MNELALALLMFSASPELVAAKSYSTNANYQKSEEILNKYNIKKNSYEYQYIKMVNAAFANNKKDTIKYSQFLLDSFVEIPRRYYALAFILRQDAEGWKDNDLEDVFRDMRNSAVRLDNSYGGKKTQQIQEQIVKKLDQQIKDIEDEIEQQKQRQAKSNEGRNKEAGERIPQSESTPGQNSGEGKVDQKKLQYLRENWGKLPEKERSKAMMELTRDLPPRYREVIENYFKALSR